MVVCSKTVDCCIDICRKYMTYPEPYIMRGMRSSTEIINKIETQCVDKIVKELEGLKDAGQDKES